MSANELPEPPLPEDAELMIEAAVLSVAAALVE